ncbi:phosphatase PAP2 family protein [Azospirillum sp. TSO22-1]|uniref:phosphatase PAP2 family protein n=1 Tax=Azospirillum sp. TSO22-1 TaxID=716789 RepID=UPI000D618157|nr:phosphatase PAP2 family protein [Azospirillum sp. TSO22-1]PWC52389.1 hypothetical protein TSO221_14600 [Azospirillum sp. TSO22-1]
MDPAILTGITDLGDSALMLPLALVLAAVLWSQQSATAALVWLGTLVPGLAVLAALKLLGHTCEAALTGPSLVSPSGHAAFATMVYGSAGVILARHLRGAGRWLAMAVPAAVAAGVAATRVLLNSHTAPEVAVGLLVGVATLAVFARRYRTLPPIAVRSHRAGALLAATVLLLVTLHGERLQAEEVIRSIAAGLRAQAGVCR